MTNDEKLQSVTRIVAEFAVAYWRDMQHRAGQYIPGMDMKMEPGEGIYLTPENIFQYTMEPQEWLVMAKYGAGLIEADSGYIYEICQGVAEWLFSLPNESLYHIPDFFYGTEFGALWAAAFIRVQGDELITITQAAELAGVSVQAISARIDRGTLRAYTDPFAPNPRQGRRLVKRGDVVEV